MAWNHQRDARRRIGDAVRAAARPAIPFRGHRSRLAGGPGRRLPMAYPAPAGEFLRPASAHVCPRQHAGCHRRHNFRRQLPDAGRTGGPIASVGLARLSWWLYLPSLPLFLAGLLQGWLVPLALGGTLLFGAIGLYVGIVLATLARAPYRDVVFWHLLTSVIGLALAASLGLLLALSKHVGFLGAFTLPIMAAHATLMLGEPWVAPLLMGVAYRLVGMFTLTEDRLHASWAWAGLACTGGGAWLLAAGLFAFDRRIELAGALGLLVGCSLFAAQLLRLYQVRRRHQFDVHIPFVLAAAAFGVSAVGLVLVGLVTGRTASDPIWVAAGWLAIAGWAETAIQGFLYKIGTFLTWLHRYAPLAGQPVPRLEDLYDRATAMFGWAAWTIGVALGAAAALTQLDLLAHLSSAGLSMGGGLFLLNAWRVGARWRTPAHRFTRTRMRPSPHLINPGGICMFDSDRLARLPPRSTSARSPRATGID